MAKKKNDYTLQTCKTLTTEQKIKIDEILFDEEPSKELYKMIVHRHIWMNNSYHLDVIEIDDFVLVWPLYSDDTKMYIIKKDFFVCPKILMIDDDGFNLLTLGNILKFLGYTSDKAKGGQIGINMILE